MIETVIKFENVRKKFGNLIAVNNFNLEIKKGEVIGFIGPNGAGKTTTLKLLARLINPNLGKIFVINNQGVLQNIFKNSRNLVELGFLIDIPHFYNSTPYLLLKYIANIRNYPKEKIKQRIDHLLQIFKLFTWKYKRINTFSKGMNQKLGFIAAVIHEPELLVLDEPQTGLDPNARIIIRKYIRSLKDEGKTVFISSHMLHEIAEVCDKIVLINQGSILGFDTMENLEHLLATKEIVCKLLNPIPTEKTYSIIQKLSQRLKPYLEENNDPLIPTKSIKYDAQEKSFLIYYDGKEKSRSSILSILINEFSTEYPITSFSKQKTSQLENIYSQMISDDDI